MKADDVLTLANRAIQTKRFMNHKYEEMYQAKRSGNMEVFDECQISFRRYKEQFCSIIDCINVVSKNAGDQYRLEGWGRCDF